MEEKKSKVLARLKVAEYALKLMDAGELPYVKQFLFGGYEVRSISDKTAFEGSNSTTSSLKSELAASKRRYTVRPVDDGAVRFYVFHEECKNELEAKLWAETLQSYLTVSYAALGMDMSALSTFEKKDSDK